MTGGTKESMENLRYDKYIDVKIWLKQQTIRKVCKEENKKRKNQKNYEINDDNKKISILS